MYADVLSRHKKINCSNFVDFIQSKAAFTENKRLLTFYTEGSANLNFLKSFNVKTLI